MKGHLSQMLQQFHGQAHRRGSENQVRALQTQTQNLERTLREKEREIDQLKHQIANYEARLQELAGRDALTGLPNRHLFKEHLTHSLKRAVRLGYSLSLLLLDIDHLKEVNLKHGFEMGDEVLSEVAKALQSSVREIDMPARWGGEELVAVLHETDGEGALLVAERIRSRVQALNIVDTKSSKRIPVSVTLAVVSYPRHGNQPAELLDSALEALVQAKQNGGNLVVVAQ
jgi:diguanylate cyclase (GGDEF)-like protein